MARIAPWWIHSVDQSWRESWAREDLEGLACGALGNYSSHDCLHGNPAVPTYVILMLNVLDAILLA